MPDLPLVSPLDRALFLRSQPHLGGASAASLAALARHTTERFFRKGEILIRDDRPARYVYFLVEGTVRTTRNGKPEFDLSAPGGVGLAHTLAGTKEPTGALALTDIVALEIGIDGFLQILEDHFELVLRLMERLSRLAAVKEDELGIVPARMDCPCLPDTVPHESLDLVKQLARARRTELFQHTSITILSQLLRDGDVVRVEDGEWLCHAGGPASALHVIVDGCVRLEDASGKRRGWVGGGEVADLQDAMTGQPRRYGLFSESPVELMEIDRALLIDVMEDHFDLSLDVLAALSRRVIALQAESATRP